DGDFSGMVEGVKLSCSKMPVEMKWKMELCRVYWSQFTAGRVRVVEEYAKRAGNGRAVERVWTA
ncbi:MAG TPA: hypothetical protein VGQ99_15990, partial [Tepidisphaeraceae bacterium]|nr:hypothetical protein [Tepidisphaeraceae bacterium]